ncbi:MAG: bis(5'-nucleosyl)-tetraphosphatase (symmetrical) YqeK [Candidatus Ventricola sp.]
MKREKMEYKLKKELDHQRFEHTLGVEQTAREMARVFGEDEEKAALAGLLHDCAKCMPLSQMVKAAKHADVDPVMKESKALMHAVAGRCVAQTVYGVQDEDVLGAIRWHTTGHANMTRLEKIIYLADVIEPNRKPYPGLEELRAQCMQDLDGAMHTALRMSLEHVKEQGKALHKDTLAALAMYEPELLRDEAADSRTPD